MKHRHSSAIKCLSLTVFAAIVPSCATDDACSSFPAELEDATRTDVSNSTIEPNAEIDRALAVIEACHGEMAYARTEFPMVFERATIRSDRNYYIFYSFIGIEDDWIVFRASPDGEVNAAFSYSPLSRFAVPE